MQAWITRLRNAQGAIKSQLPLLGILAFSLCSVNSVYYLLEGNAEHPHPLLWTAAGLVEIVTAWLVFQCVDTGRKLTRSRIGKGDRHFYGTLLALFIALALPSLGLSIVANSVEFGTPWLGWVFPAMSVGCAVGAALPGVAGRYEQRKETERQEAARKKAERTQRRESEAQEVERRAALMENLGAASVTLRALMGNPGATIPELMAAAERSKKTIGNHLAVLEAAGVIARQNGRIVMKEGTEMREEATSG